MNSSGRFEGRIEALAFGGDGVTHTPEGLTVFVPASSPGDRLSLQIHESHKTYARAKIVEVLERGPGRIDAPCPAFGECGGCQWQHLEYAAQLSAKENFVRESLRRIGGFDNPTVKGILPAPHPFGYRNKVILPADGSHFGFYRLSSHDVVPLPEAGCAIQSDSTNLALKFLRGQLAGKQGVKHALVRSNSRGEILIALVSVGPLDWDVSSWFKALPGLQGVVNNLQPRPGNVVLGSETRTLHGKSFIVEELDGLKFRLSASSFFQVNSEQAKGLWTQLLGSRDWAQAGEVLDLYCGVGTLSLPLARAGARVVGVENWPSAVEDARLNATLNDLKNVRFECADAAEGFKFCPEPVALLVDPPRKGLSEAVLKAIIASAPKEIFYISCDPSSLSRDLKQLAGSGWHLESVQPLDMFPQTYHVESLSILRR